jgi:hypothetical protein
VEPAAQSRGKPIMPINVDQRRQFMNEPFRFFVDAQGKPVGERPASAFFSTTAFDYDYVYARAATTCWRRSRCQLPARCGWCAAHAPMAPSA